MTSCNKPVTRKVELAIIRDKGRFRELVVTVFPNGTIGLRPYGTRRMEVLPATSAWSLATKMRVAHERAEKRSTKKSKESLHASRA